MANRCLIYLHVISLVAAATSCNRVAEAIVAIAQQPAKMGAPATQPHRARTASETRS